jgi:hypothetical protein
MLGSAATDLAWLCEGHLDAFIILANHPWDVSAGVVLERETGYTVVDIDGNDYSLHSRATIAVHRQLLPELLDLVQSSVDIVVSGGSSSADRTHAEANAAREIPVTGRARPLVPHEPL